MLIDLVCKRYPNQKPSDYLDIKDSYTAFQLDTALALAGETSDREFVVNLVESINDHLVNVMRSMGAKIKVKSRGGSKTPISKDKHVNEVLMAIGGTGSVVKYNKKHGS